MGGPADAKSPARPALWEVSDPDTKIYLFGTIHLLPEKFAWRTAKFDEAVRASQQLVVETIIDLQRPQEFASAFAQTALSAKPLTPILERVPTGKRAALAAAIKKIGATPGQFDRVKTWAVAFQLMSLQFANAGLRGQEGPETALRQEFTAANKPVGQLETNQEQLSFFDSMSEKGQRALLESTIDNPDQAGKELSAILGAWVKGDVRTMARSFQDQTADSPELKDALFDRRNANWKSWIEQRLAQPGTIMLAVGADHLAAKDSVIDLLRRDGYRVRRLQ